MRAVVVTPGEAGSGRLDDVPAPVRGPDQVLVEVLEVGVCGTDVEILDGHYGTAPEGDDHLIIGHESFGRVLEAPDGRFRAQHAPPAARTCARTAASASAASAVSTGSWRSCTQRSRSTS